MSKNVNVFIGVLLCAVLCGTFVWLSSSGDESSWSPNDIYNEVQGTGSVGGYATTSATFSSSSNDGGVALPMSSSFMRARRAPLYAGAYSGASHAPLASSPLASSPISGASGAGLHLTSSAEIKSFGGGGNGGAAMGGSMRSASAPNNFIAASPSSPIASVPRRLFATSSNAKDMPSATPISEPMATVAASASGYATSYYGSQMLGTYGEYTSIFGGTPASYSGIRGRQNGADLTDSWFEWMLDWLMANNGPINDGSGWYFNDDYLDALYAAFLARWEAGGFVGVQPPTQADFEAWFLAGVGESGGKFSENNIYWAPVGDILPLLLIVLLYMIFVAIKYKSLKSLLKTERSE